MHSYEDAPAESLPELVRDDGKSYRQIAEELGYKSRTSVIKLLNN